MLAVPRNFEKVKALNGNSETQDMIKASLALYDFVLPGYRTEYQELVTFSRFSRGCLFGYRSSNVTDTS